MSNPTPEMRLAELFNLAAEVEQRIVSTDGQELLAALRAARAAIAARIHAVTKTLAQSPPPPSVEIDVSTLKIGDEVWARGRVSQIDGDDPGRSVYLTFTDGDAPHFQRAWPDVTRLRRAV